MTDKDNWDKFDIIFKTIALGLIPIVIGIGTSHIAQSLKKGDLVRSLISDLNQADARRDVALIALDAAIEENRECAILWVWGCQDVPKHDQVLKIAMVLVSTSIEDVLKKGQSPEELNVAREIIERRANPKYYDDHFAKRINDLQARAQLSAISSVDPHSAKLASDEISHKANIAQTIAAIQPSRPKVPNETLPGVRLVYIQYYGEEALSKKIQAGLQSAGVSAPGTEQREGIKENSIRYSNSSDEQVAESLQRYLAGKHGIQIDKLIDLSKSGYTAPSGQFEVWLE